MKPTLKKSTRQKSNPTKLNKAEVALPTAQQFIAALKSHQSSEELKKNKRFYNEDDHDICLGVRMGTIFSIAKEFIGMPIKEIEKLFDNPYYEVRMGAVSIMDFQARNKKTSAAEKKALFELYIDHHDRINNWDLVDRSAPYVVGGYLFDKPRAILYKLAKSKNIWERRTAIVSTYFFIRQGDINDTFKIAELLVKDKEDLIHKAVGSWIREAGKRDKQKLISFLDKYAGIMPRTMLRYATEKLDKKQKDFYLKK